MLLEDFPRAPPVFTSVATTRGLGIVRAIVVFLLVATLFCLSHFGKIIKLKYKPLNAEEGKSDLLKVYNVVIYLRRFLGIDSVLVCFVFLLQFCDVDIFGNFCTKRMSRLWIVFEKKIRSKSFSSCLLYTSPSPRDRQKSRMPSSA